MIIDESHRSPNVGSRNGAHISMIVLHATVGSYASALAWLCNPASKVSSHYLIRKDGHIAQLVPDDRAAWHAGASAHDGMTSAQIRNSSLGIELENANTGRDAYPPAQIAACHQLCQAKISRYNIERADVVRHLDIAVPKGRKTDPAAPFPWPAFADSLYMDATPDAPDRHYIVKAAATGGATIRAAPSKAAAVLGRLHAGDSWTGELITGQIVTLPDFGSSNQWVRSSDMRCVWSGLLQEV